MIIGPNLQLRKLCLFFLGMVFALTLLSFILGAIVISQGRDAGIFDKLFTVFNVDYERNIPTWVSSTSLALVGVSYLLVAFYRQNLQKNFVVHWFFLGLIFLGLSLDEFAQFHEQLIRPMRELLNTDGFLYYPWILPAAILTVVVGTVYLRFIHALMWESRSIFLLAGLLYVGGALGIEAIGGKYFDMVIRSQDIPYDLSYLFITHLEELFEMSAIILFLYVGLRYIQIMGHAKSMLVSADSAD